MCEEIKNGFREEAAIALELMERALELLDRCPSALDVSPHLDLAICRLRDLINTGGPHREVARITP